MAKLESTFKNMVLSLVIISMVAAGALAGVYILTLEKIEAQKQKQKEQARLSVLNGHEDGMAIETKADGFGGPIHVMVGFDHEGNILGYEILEPKAETPGLGSHIEHWFKNAEKPGQYIIGRKAGKLQVSKDNPAEKENSVDAITAATISSRAFLKAINEAYAEQFGAEAHTGASQLNVQNDSVQSEEIIIIEETEVKDE